MAGIVVYASLNHAALDRGIVEANAKVGKFARDIQRQGAGIEAEMGMQLKRAAERLAAYGTIFAGIGLAQQIIKVRGEFQQLGIAFETMLGSKEKADRMMEQSFKFAQKTPFDMMQVTSNAKQLMAMGVSFEKVMSTMKSLGDVAAGVSVPLSRVVINYGQVLALGRLQYREVRDFAMAGIPLTDELAKNLGKTNKEILALISAGKIGFPEVERAFQTMSGEGGKFYNLMEKQNASLTGQISNLVDKWQMALNDLGKSQEGFIYSGIKGAALVVENLKPILTILGDLVIAYGAYRTALILTGSVKTLRNTIIYLEEAKALSTLMTAEAAARVSKQGLVVGSMAYASAINAEIIAQGRELELTAASTAKKLAAGQLELATRVAILDLRKADLVAAEAELALANAGTSTIAKKTVVANLNSASLAVNTATTEVNTAAKQVEILATKNSIASTAASTFATNVNTASKTANVTVSGMFVAAQNAMVASLARVKAAMLANPYTAIAVALAAIGFAIYKVVTADTELEKAEKSLQETLKRTREEKDNIITDADQLVNKIRTETNSVYDQIKAFDELIKKYEFFKKYSIEDIRKMTADEWRKVQQEFNIGVDKSSAQKNYTDQVKKIAEINAEIKRVEGKLGVGAPRERKQLAAAQIVLKEYEKELQKVSEEEKRARIGSLPIKEQEQYYKNQLASLKAQADGIDKLLVKENEKKLPDIFGMTKSKESLDLLKTQISETEKILNGFREKDLADDKLYWEDRLKRATEVQESIGSAQLKILRGASKSQLESGNIKGISKDVITSFMSSEADIKKATSQLKVYERAKIDSDQTIENNKNRLIEQRSKNELFAATVLQGKLLRVEEETTRQKLAIAENEYQKNLAQLEKNKLDTLQALKKLGKEWQPEDEATYQQGIKASEEVFMAAKVEINRQAAEEIDRIWQEVEDYRLTGYEKELAALNKKFREEEKILKKTIVNHDELQSALDNLFLVYQEKRAVIETKFAIQGFDLQMELQQKKNEATIGGLNRERKIEEENFKRYVYWTELKIAKGIESTDEQIRNNAILTQATLDADKRIWEERQKDINKFSRNIDTLGKILGDALSSSSDEFVKRIGEAVGNITNSIGQIQKSDNSFSKVSGIISLAITVGNYLKEIRLWNENKALEAQRKITGEVATRLQFENELNKILIERNQITEKSVFGLEDYGKTLSDSAKLVFSQNELLNKSLAELFKNSIFSASGESKRNLFGTKKGDYEFTLGDILGGNAPNFKKEDITAWFGMGTGIADNKVFHDLIDQISSGDWLGAIGKVLDPLHLFGGGDADKRAKLDAYNNLSKAVSDALKTMGKTVADFSSMSTQDMLTFFDLMEKTGFITDESTKKLLATAKEQLAEAQKAIDKMKEVFGAIVGDLGTSLSDSLVEAFANKDLYSAIDAFHTKVGDVIADLVAQMVFAATMQPFFTKAQNAFMASYGLNPDGTPMNQDQLNAVDAQGKRIVDNSIIDDLENLGNDIEGGMSDYEKAIIEADEMLKRKGFGGIGSKGRDKSAGLAGQIQRTVTEESAGEWIGLVRRESDDIRGIRDYAKIGIGHLLKIEQNTYISAVEIVKSNEKLDKIIKNTTTTYTGVL